MSHLLLDTFRFLAHYTIFAFVVFCGVAYLAHLVFRQRISLYSLLQSHGKLIAMTAGIASTVGFVAVGIWYLRMPGFAGEVEPLISSISWLVQKGQPLYHDLNAPERYSVLYGPSVFLTNGLFLEFFGPSLMTAKLASFVAALLSVGLFYAATARRRLDPLAVGLVGALVLYFWTHRLSIYLVRPDSMILAALCFGLFAAARTRRILAILAVAAAAGFTVNLKVHAGLYFLPVFGVLADRWGWRSTICSMAATVGVILLPFAFYSQVSLGNYLLWLDNAAKHGLTTVTLALTMRFTVFLFLPLLVLRLAGLLRPNWAADHRNLVMMILPTTLAALLLSNKPGAGLVHMLPLVPTVLFVTGLALRGISQRLNAVARPRYGSSLVAALLVTVLLSGSVHEYQSVRMVNAYTGESHDLCADLEDIMKQYPGKKIGMACGGEASNFRKTWMRPLLVFQNNPLFLDPISVMDCCLSGQDLSPETYTAMADGLVDLWLVPRQNAPFVKLNWYPPHSPIFSERFIKNFHEHFTRVGSSEFFDLWFWDGLGGEKDDSPGGSKKKVEEEVAQVIPIP